MKKILHPFTPSMILLITPDCADEMVASMVEAMGVDEALKASMTEAIVARL